MEGKATGEFKLRITKALADQLAETLDQLVPVNLTSEALTNLVEPRPGVYLLYHLGQLVYVGKAASDLRDRLGDHRWKISGRTGIRLDDVKFKCAYVDEDLDAAAPETLLIKKYKATGEIPWNTNGFGNHDPGRQRDHTMVKEGHFDALYPIDLDIEIDLGGTRWALGELLKRINKLAPYTVRCERKKDVAKRTLNEVAVTVEPVATIRYLVERIVSAMPRGWQATVLPGALILYPESATYESALGWYRSTDTAEAIWASHKMRVEHEG